MRGEVLRYSDETGDGLISGDDGTRYRFSRGDLKQLVPLAQGARVDFDTVEGEEGARATEIILLDEAPAAAPAAAAAPASGPLESSNEDLGMWAYFRKCLSKYVDGNGRARRKEIWSFVLFVFLFSVVAAILDALIIAAAGMYLPIFSVIVGLGFLLPSLTVFIRRLHDIGLSGWLALLMLIPYLNILFYLVIALIPSQLQVNQHGLYPKPLPPQPA